MIIEPKSNTEPAAPRPASPSPSASTESSASVSSASSDEPPPYSPADPTSPTSPLSSSSTLSLPRIRPANFLSITRSGDAPLYSAYVLDPYLQIPTALLRAADSGNGSPRPNLKLETKEGSIDGEVWVIPHATAVMRGNAPTPSAASTSTPLGTPVVKVDLKSYSGPVSLRVHTPSPTPVQLQITVASTAGSISVNLPRSFRGSFSSAGSLSLSPQIDEALTIFDEVDATRQGWIGDFDSNEHSDTSSSVHLETTYGVLHLSYLDEVEHPATHSTQSLPLPRFSISQQTLGPSMSSMSSMSSFSFIQPTSMSAITRVPSAQTPPTVSRISPALQTAFSPRRYISPGSTQDACLNLPTDLVIPLPPTRPPIVNMDTPTASTSTTMGMASTSASRRFSYPPSPSEASCSAPPAYRQHPAHRRHSTEASPVSRFPQTTEPSRTPQTPQIPQSLEASLQPPSIGLPAEPFKPDVVGSRGESENDSSVAIPRGVVNWICKSLEHRFGIQSPVTIRLEEVKGDRRVSRPHELGDVDGLEVD